jgi:hypothetical protein
MKIGVFFLSLIFVFSSFLTPGKLKVGEIAPDIQLVGTNLD